MQEAGTRKVTAGITGASSKSKMSFKLGHGDGEVEKVFGMTALTRVRKTSKEFEG